MSFNRRTLLALLAGGFTALSLDRPIAQPATTARTALPIPTGDASAVPSVETIPFIDSFGPVGTADDTATLNKWLSSGRPARFRPITYMAAGPLAGPGASQAMGFGEPGKTIIRRPTGLKATNWFNLAAPTIWMYGIIWDMGGQAGAAGWGVVLASTVTRARLERCQFNNNQGGGQGCGLTVIGRAKPEDPLVLEIIDCAASGNGRHGIWLASVRDTLVANCELHHNGGGGISVNPFDPRPGRFPAAERVTLRNINAHDNHGGGIGIGSSDIGTGDRHIFDLAGSFDVTDVVVEGARTANNGGYGVFMDAPRSVIRNGTSINDGGNNRQSGLAGVSAAGRGSRIINCSVKGSQTFGYDAGALLGGSIENCSADGTSTAFNLGSFQNLTCRGLKVANCLQALNCERVELSDAKFGDQFNIVSKGLTIEDLTVDITNSRATGRPPGPIIMLLDRPEDVEVKALRVLDPQHKASPGVPLIYALTDSFRIGSYTYNGSDLVPVTPRNGVLTVPDQAVSVVVAGNPTITSVEYWTQQQVGDGIAWWNLTKPATGLTAQPRFELQEKLRAGQDDRRAAAPLVETFNGATTGLMFGGGLDHGRGYAGAAARITPSNGVGQAGEAVAQIGVPLRKGAELKIALPQGGMVLGTRVGPSGAIALAESAGKWVVKAHG